MPESPSTQNQVPTGFIMNVSKLPADLCSCEDGPAEMKLGAR